MPIPDHLTFKNTRWHDSPIAEANFHDESGTGGAVIRVYTGVVGDRAWSVLVGLTGDPKLEFQNGWSVVGEVVTLPGVTVLELRRQ